MAEAFGLAASATGIVSLGLQVYEGVASYVEGVKDRKSELAAISKQANNLQAIVRTIQAAAPQIDAIITSNKSPLFSSLKTVKEELWALESFLSSLKGVSGQSSRIASVLQEQKKKLVYPFHRPTLEKLQKRLDSANNALQTSLQVVNLMATTSISTAVSEVHTTVNNSQSSLVGLQSGIGSLESAMESMATSLTPTQASLGSMEGKLDWLVAEKRTENEHLETNFKAIHTNVGHVSHKLQQTMSTVQMSTGTLHEEIQQQSTEFRQLRDLVSESLLQSAASEIAMREATQAMSQKMMTSSQTSDGTSASTKISPPQLVMRRLLSKTSELKDAHELDHLVTAHDTRKYDVPSSTIHKSCSCQPKTITQHQIKKFGNLYISRKTAVRSGHLPSCGSHVYDSQITTHAGTLLYTGFRRLLSASLELSFSWTSGAGGPSMSPNITLRPMVDETKSPVFQLVELAKDNAEALIRFTCVEQKSSLGQFLDHSVDLILRLYRSRQCSPYDVNHEGKSIVHKWAELLFFLKTELWKSFHGSDELIEMISIASGPSMRHLITRLSPSGLLFDYNGDSPLDHVFVEDSGRFAFTDLVELREVATVICSFENEITTRTYEGLKQSGSIIGQEDFFLMRDTNIDLAIMSEMIGIGPLGRSIMAGDRARSRFILDTNPHALKEKTIGLQTPFHLAAISSSPKLMKALLEAAQDGSTHFDTPDRDRRSALDVASSASSKICRNGRGLELCTDCACSLHFDMLHSNGWRLSPERYCFPYWLLSGASCAVKIKVISEVKRVREEIRATALRCLSTYECQRLQLDSSRVLDGNLHSVLQRLLESGLDIPEEYKDLASEMLVGRKDCIYHDATYATHPGTSKDCIRFFDLLFDNGFEEVDHQNANRETPLFCLVNHTSIEDSADIILWFIQHGARTRRVIEAPWNRSGETLAHRILKLRNISKLKYTQYSSIAKVISRVAPIRFPDKCRCACSVSGCTTTAVFFRHLWEILFRNDSRLDLQHSRQVQGHFQRIRKDLFKTESASKCDDGDNDDNSVWDGSSDLGHGKGIDTDDDMSSQWESCSSESSWEYDEENSHTALWQSARQLSIFLQLLEVDFVQWDHVSLSALKIFTFEALEIRHTCCHQITGQYPWHRWEGKIPLSDEEIDEMQEEDHEQLCLLDDLVDEFVSELQFSGDTLPRFLIRYWAPRMQRILENRRAAKMNPEQVFASEQVGVIWESGSESEEDEESCPPSPTSSERFEWLMQEMDEIMLAATQTDST